MPKKKCPICRRKFDKRGYYNHLKKCTAIQKNAKASREDIKTKKIYEDGDTKCVALRSTKGRDSKKVRDFFLSHPGESVTPKQLAVLTNIKRGSAKVICRRFLAKGFLEQPIPSHYKYTPKINAEDLELLQKFENVKFHNIMLQIPSFSGNAAGVNTNLETNVNSLYNASSLCFEVPNFGREQGPSIRFRLPHKISIRKQFIPPSSGSFVRFKFTPVIF